MVSSPIGRPLSYSEWSGWRSGDAAAAAGIENKIIAWLALREAQELALCFFKTLYCLDPQVLAVWETTKNIQLALHGPSRLEISHTISLRQLACQRRIKLKIAKLLGLRREIPEGAVSAVEKVRKFFRVCLRRQKSTRTRTHILQLHRLQRPCFFPAV